MTEPLRAKAIPGLQAVPIALIDPSPSNPRKHIDPVEQQKLVESIREVGLLEPVILRPKGRERFELVVGERRWRAHATLGAIEIESKVVEMDDARVLLAQIAENKDREGVTPLEEADAVRELVEVHKMTIEQVVVGLGEKLSARLVAERLVVARAPECIRDLLRDELVTFPAATLLARAPEAMLEQIATRVRADAGRAKRALSRHDVDVIVDRFARALMDAPFDLLDGKLLKESSKPCSTCTERTAAQGALFSDSAGDDRCLNAACWNAKVEAVWERAQKDAKKRKLPVLAEVFDGTSTGHVRARDVAKALGEKKTWGEVAGSRDIVIGRDAHGRVLELVAPEAVARLSAAMEPERPSAPAAGQDATVESEEERVARLAARRVELARQDQQAVFTAARLETITRLVSEASTNAMLRALARGCSRKVMLAHHLAIVPETVVGLEAIEAFHTWLEQAPAVTVVRAIVIDTLIDDRFENEETLDGILAPLESDRAAE